MNRKNCLVIINSASSRIKEATEQVIPYLDHFGVAYQVCDIHRSPLPFHLDAFSLLIIAHAKIDPRGWSINRSRIIEAIESGVGLVNFDPSFVTNILRNEKKGYAEGDQVTIARSHPVTLNHLVGDTISLASNLRFPFIPGTALLEIDGKPVVSFLNLGKGRILNYASIKWMKPHCLGPLGGLDDIFWRALVWSAKKPFVMRGLPPLVTMRVDDVAGTGHLWGQTPLFWAKIAFDYGFKPWMGLFIGNLTSETIAELRQFLLHNNATAFPHAFGRPNRTEWREGNPCPFYDTNYFPLRSNTYDEFIYYNHEQKRPWSNREAQQGLLAVDNWYRLNTPLPISPYAIAHWGEMGSNVITHIHDHWKCDRIATYHGLDAPLENADWLIAGPFRKFGKPGSALFEPERCGKRPVYYADFINFADRQFFLCCTEIRDDAGYEWAPDNDVFSSSNRGIRQLQRALNSMALPVLFTHETDYIYKISPQAWDEQLKRITQAISGYQPIYVTLDEGVRYVRSTKTSHISSCDYDPDNKEIRVVVNGFTDMQTYFYLFSEVDQSIEYRLVAIPEFQGETSICFKI